MMRRRAFITLLGGAVAAWPLWVRAQQTDRMPRIGVITNIARNDPESQSRNAAFEQALEQVGRTNGRNVHIDYRWTGGRRGHAQTGGRISCSPGTGYFGRWS